MTLLFRLLATALSPFMFAQIAQNVVRRGEGLADLQERFSTGEGHAGAVWIHGASVGELSSAKALAQALLDGDPTAHLIITSNTRTGRDMVQAWDLPRTRARLAPLDLHWVIKRFRQAWQPRLLITMENEIWPIRWTTIDAPILVVSGRMSAKSAKRWQRLSGLTETLFEHVVRLYPQDDTSAGHFVDLGLSPEKLGKTGNLKAEVVLDPPPPEQLAAMRNVFDVSNTWLAASTHDGEEPYILAAFEALREERPELKLIIAPRHPERAAEIIEMLEEVELSYAQRSAGAEPTVSDAVYLADTIGEMALWYSLAGVTFVGGSLVAKGGHTPYEPAKFGTAIVHGPHLANFVDPYATLSQAAAATRVTDVESLTTAVAALLDSDAWRDQAQRANKALYLTVDNPAPLDGIVSVARGFLNSPAVDG
ncbi:MAG: glycosyltransferase N-terminal domain-containing protein [Pseudomonadota bacterium]